MALSWRDLRSELELSVARLVRDRMSAITANHAASICTAGKQANAVVAEFDALFIRLRDDLTNSQLPPSKKLFPFSMNNSQSREIWHRYELLEDELATSSVTAKFIAACETLRIDLVAFCGPAVNPDYISRAIQSVKRFALPALVNLALAQDFDNATSRIRDFRETVWINASDSKCRKDIPSGIDPASTLFPIADSPSYQCQPRQAIHIALFVFFHLCLTPDLLLLKRVRDPSVTGSNESPSGSGGSTSTGRQKLTKPKAKRGSVSNADPQNQANDPVVLHNAESNGGDDGTKPFVMVSNTDNPSSLLDKKVDSLRHKYFEPLSNYVTLDENSSFEDLGITDDEPFIDNRVTPSALPPPFYAGSTSKPGTITVNLAAAKETLFSST
ncbi:hypothetical protein HDU93_000788 [Gonapodya sp. JEL0774]|nr:hypothetical protein HDU93_000788 [Gonapodya sp. JEL0774]